MTNKQTSAVSKANFNLCEINREYPLTSKELFIPRHLSTSEKIVKPGQCNHVHQLPNIVNKEQQIKIGKHVQEQTEIIELFLCKPEEEQSSRRGRYRRNRAGDDDDDNERDNTN